ncbi:MAG: L,D-transpeptidase family protein [Verrucomicrobia bacterium]|nr:L,D-transpeptidase family protein [Verrucomicrobiota bacterium]
MTPAPARKHLLFIVVLVTLLGGGLLFWRSGREHRVPEIPSQFARDLPASCTQALLVLAESDRATTGNLWMLERVSAAEDWKAAGGPIPVSLGRSGLAWGVGEHRAQAPSGFRMKKEGDGCSPAGIFRIPYAFGYASTAPDLNVKYAPVTPTLIGVDDGKSKYYNQVIETAGVSVDWDSHETMLREDGLYRWGAFVAHNSTNTPGGGSCIFLHIWRGPGKPTSGCTAMSEDDLVRILKWMDPSKQPRLVQSLTK